MRREIEDAGRDSKPATRALIAYTDLCRMAEGLGIDMVEYQTDKNTTTAVLNMLRSKLQIAIAGARPKERLL